MSMVEEKSIVGDESIADRVERAYAAALVVQSFVRVMDPHGSYEAGDTDLVAAAYVLRALVEPLVDLLDGAARRVELLALQAVE